MGFAFIGGVIEDSWSIFVTERTIARWVFHAI